MTMSIHERLDREAARLQSSQGDSITSVSDSFIAGVEHAATIAYRMGNEPPREVNPEVIERVQKGMARQMRALMGPGYVDHYYEDLAAPFVSAALNVLRPSEVSSATTEVEEPK